MGVCGIHLGDLLGGSTPEMDRRVDRVLESLKTLINTCSICMARRNFMQALHSRSLSLLELEQIDGKNCHSNIEKGCRFITKFTSDYTPNNDKRLIKNKVVTIFLTTCHRRL